MKTDTTSRYSILDNVTGETIAFDIRILGTEKSFKKEKKKFFKFMNVFAEEILMDKELSGKAIKLLFWILKQLDFNETTFILSAEYVVKDLGVTRRTYYYWKKVLEKKGIIKKITGDLYTLNPNCVFYGHADKQETAENVINKIKTAKLLTGGENNA
jgi:hypothetical protein